MSVGVRSMSKRKLMIVLLVSSIVGILVVVLGSAMYKAGPYNKSTAATVQTPVMVAPSLIPPCTANERVVTPVIDAPKVAITTSSAPLLLQTPGAGPSTLATAGQRGSSSSATTKTNEVKDEVIVKPSLALSVHAPSGTTRQGSATPFIVRNGLCGRGSRKGKEKEIVSEQYTDTGGQTDSMTLDRPLLLEGPKTPLSLGYIIRGVKAVLNDHLPSESQETKSNSITDLLALSTIVNFEELLDELVVRIMSKTTSILQDLSSAAAVHAGSLISAAGQAKVTLERHGSLVRSGAKILVKHVKEQHRMARMGFNAVRAGEFQAVVKAAKMQGYNVKKGCKVVEYGLRSAVVEGQRMLAEAFGGIEAADAVEAEAE
ncbi:hypothetical protein FRB90_006933 [Tulasnella sp. 427]|nr:hypothetical protein FRB90_006933 [Tulasnella sp. 427]